MKIIGMHAAQSQGGRSSMEDRLVVSERQGKGLFAGVFDGHGGPEVADYLAAKFPETFFDEWTADRDPSRAFTRAFARMEDDCRAHESGSTAVCVFVDGMSLTVANCGDAPAVVVGTGVVTLSRRHTVNDPEENDRIRAAGGIIRPPYFFHHDRGIMPTRSFGDVVMRKVGLNAMPSVAVHPRKAEDRFVVLSSDGIFDVMSAEDVAAGVRGKTNAREAAECLIAGASDRGATDNLTAVVIELGPSGTSYG